MTVARQETNQNTTIDERAVREVEGYIDKIERQVEITADQGQKQNTPSQPAVTKNPTINDMGSMVAQQAHSSGKLNIVLPIDETEVKKGLHHQVIDGARWLAEWCIFMIKKYPGRVFYPVNNGNSNTER